MFSRLWRKLRVFAKGGNAHVGQAAPRGSSSYFVQCIATLAETVRSSKPGAHSQSVVYAQGDCQRDSRLRSAAIRGWAEGGASLTDQNNGFAWPDTPIGVIKADDGYEFFASDGGLHSRQLWQGRWYGNK